MNKQALFLLIAFQFTHWLADYTWLSTRWMLSAKRLGQPLLPILAHASVHYVLVSLVLLPLWVVSPLLWIELGMFQLLSHFAIDVLKGRMNMWFQSLQNPANVLHWCVFGFDQMLHQVVLILITYFAINCK